MEQKKTRKHQKTLENVFRNHFHYTYLLYELKHNQRGEKKKNKMKKNRKENVNLNTCINNIIWIM